MNLKTLPPDAAQLATQARNAIAEITRLCRPPKFPAWQTDEDFEALQNAEQARQSAAQNSSNSGSGMSGETINFHGPINVHDVKDGKKFAEEATKSGFEKLSRRSRANQLQAMVQTGF
jgi:hypothetical protein